MYKNLFSPIVINKLEIRNRIAYPSLGLLYSHDSALNDRYYDYFREKARGGAGIVTVGPVGVDFLGAGPIALSLAALGAPALWRTRRPLAVLCGVLALVYLNELWLAPFGQRVSLDLMRGLSVLALPVAVAGGLALSARPKLAPWLLAACSLWTASAAVWAVPRSCQVRPVALEELRDLEVSRCTFTWRGPAIRRPSG